MAPPPPQNLEREVSSHEALIQAVVGTGRKLVQAGHLAAQDVAAQVQRLEDAMGRLRAGAVRQWQRLQQAREAQQFLMEVRAEAERRGLGWARGHAECVQARERTPTGAPALCTSTRWSPAPKVIPLHVSRKTDHWAGFGFATASKSVVLSQWSTWNL